ncbi:MAG: hypothetical protein ACRDL5_06525 [Solirubrobacteraceae bacterium]
MADGEEQVDDGERDREPAAKLRSAPSRSAPRAPRPRRLDPIAQVLIVVLLAGVTAGTIEGPRQGWTAPLIVGCYAAAVAALAVSMVEWRRREPLIDPRFFASAPFSGAALIAVAAFGALAGFLFLNTIYLQSARGYSAIVAGLLILPIAATNVVTARRSGRLVAAVSGMPPAQAGSPLR